MANNYLCQNYFSKLRKIFPKIPKISGGSLWIQKLSTNLIRKRISYLMLISTQFKNVY